MEDRPPTPPTTSSQKAAELSDDISYMESVTALFTERNMLMLIISYGMNVGVFYAVSTLLNQIINSAFPTDVGNAGLVGAGMTVAGTLGSIVSGSILDRTHWYRQVAIAIYGFSFLGYIGFMLSLNISFTLTFMVTCFLGFFMTGYLPIGFEYAAELSYPAPEGTSAGLLNASCQLFGITFCYLGTILVDKLGHLYANYSLLALLCVGFVLTICIKGDLKRQQAMMSDSK